MKENENMTIKESDEIMAQAIKDLSASFSATMHMMEMNRRNALKTYWGDNENKR